MVASTRNKWFGVFALIGVLLLFVILYCVFSPPANDGHLDSVHTEYGYGHQIGGEHRTDSEAPGNRIVTKSCKPAYEGAEELEYLTKIEDIDEGIAELHDYFPIHEDVVGNMLSEIEKKNVNLTSQEQLDNLFSVLKDNILAYKHGSAKEVLADRLRAPYSIKPEATQWHLKILNRHYKKEGETFPKDPEKIMRLLVSRRYGGKNGSGYKNLYNQMSVAGSQFVFNRVKKIPMSITDHLWLLNDTRAKTFKNGVITPHPSIKYRNSPQKVLEKYGELLYVDVSIAASNADDLKYSRLKRYYWSEDDKTWLPMEVVSLYARQRKADEFF